jgi:SAM-dependent methyltransferase
VKASESVNENKMNKDDPVYVQYGCGQSCPVGWINFDASPNVILQKVPIIRSFIRTRFPKQVRYGNIVRGLPFAEGSVDGIYASHVLEHLSLDEFWKALENTFVLLRPGGSFRLVVPDLEVRTRTYLERLSAGEAESNSWFMRISYLGCEHRWKGLNGLLRVLFGHSAHLWMWDERSISAALKKIGFIKVRRASFNDSSDDAFLLVEDAGRFFDVEIGADECAIEAYKPSPTKCSDS